MSILYFQESEQNWDKSANDDDLPETNGSLIKSVPPAAIEPKVS